MNKQKQSFKYTLVAITFFATSYCFGSDDAILNHLKNEEKRKLVKSLLNEAMNGGTSAVKILEEKALEEIREIEAPIALDALHYLEHNVSSEPVLSVATKALSSIEKANINYWEGLALAGKGNTVSITFLADKASSGSAVAQEALKNISNNAANKKVRSTAKKALKKITKINKKSSDIKSLRK